MRMKFWAVVALGGLAAAGHAAAPKKPAGPAPLVPETLSQVELKDQMQPHWLWVNDVAFNHMNDGRAYLLDADAGEFLGMISAGQAHGVVQIMPDGKSIAVPETYYARGSRGKRTDVITFYAIRDLKPGGEVEIPPKRLQSLPFVAAAPATGDGRFSLVYNFTPEQSISVVDLPARKFVGEYPTPGCGAIHLTGLRSFIMQCQDGSLQAASIGADGAITLGATTTPLFRREDPAIEKPVRLGEARYLFTTYAGEAVEVDAAQTPTVAARWSLQGADGAGWRPGGLQPAAYHAPSGRMFVLMHQGGANTQKQPGSEIWVYDVAARARVARYPLPELATAIAISGDAHPLLYTALFGSGTLVVRDPATGAVLRRVTGVGGDLTVIQPAPIQP